MSRQNSPEIESDPNKYSTSVGAFPSGLGGVPIEQALDRLEEIVLSSPHIPLSRRTVVDEEQLLDQLDAVRSHLPTVIQEAEAIVAQKQEILLQAQQQAEEIVKTAQARAVQMVSETEIVQQAELAAEQLRQQMRQEYITAQEQNLVEIDRMRQQAQQELEEMRRIAIAESEEIQHGADEYANTVLTDLEQQLSAILRIIRNGRQQLKSTNPPNPNLPRN